MPAAVRVLRVLALLVVGAALVMSLGWAAVYLVSESRFTQKISVPADSVAVPTDIASVQRGQHVASAVAMCIDCHGPNLAGKVLVDDPAVGRFVAPNLTRGRGGAALSNDDLIRAIRHGLDPSGRQLLIMPSDQYNRLSDAHLGAIVAYVRSLPAIDTSLPRAEVRPIGRVLFLLGQLPLLASAHIDRAAPRPVPPQPGVSVEYGEYLATVAGCPSCHGVPSASTPLADLGKWSEADFLNVMRTGTRPDGRRLAAAMPWPYFAQMTDDELRAILRFLRAVPSRASGTR
jgi:mono/diheme cytochrome c family protein